MVISVVVRAEIGVPAAITYFFGSGGLTGSAVGAAAAGAAAGVGGALAAGCEAGWQPVAKMKKGRTIRM